MNTQFIRGLSRSVQYQPMCRVIYPILLLCVANVSVFGQGADTTGCVPLSDSVHQDCEKRTDSLLNDNHWYGGFAVALGVGACGFTELPDSNNELTPAVSSLEGGLACGKKNLYVSLGLSSCGDGIWESRDNDTIRSGTQKFSPIRVWLFQAPLIAHYRCDLAKWIGLRPEAGVTYVKMKRDVRGYDTSTNMATVNVDDNSGRFCPQVGGNLALSVPRFFWKREGVENRILFEGNYTRLFFDDGADILQAAVSISDEQTRPQWLRSGVGLFLRSYRGKKLKVIEVGLFGTGFFNLVD